MKTTNELTEDIINLICECKDTFWKYGLESQLNWFSKYINSNDKHIVMFNFDKIIGYGSIRNVDNYFILDSILVKEKYRNNGFGKKIVTMLMDGIEDEIYLLCERKNILFYEKVGFKINNNTTFLDKDINGLNIMSYKNNTLIENIKYYINVSGWV